MSISQSLKKNFLCASSATTLLMLTHCLPYCVSSFNYGDSRARDVGPTMAYQAMALPADHSEQLPDSISTCERKNIFLNISAIAFFC